MRSFQIIPWLIVDCDGGRCRRLRDLAQGLGIIPDEFIDACEQSLPAAVGRGGLLGRF